MQKEGSKLGNLILIKHKIGAFTALALSLDNETECPLGIRSAD
jgi:hypothetical protein